MNSAWSFVLPAPSRPHIVAALVVCASQLGLVGWGLQARHGARLRVMTAPGSAPTPHFWDLGDEYGNLRNTLVRDSHTPLSSQVPGCWVLIFGSQKLSHPLKGVLVSWGSLVIRAQPGRFFYGTSCPWRENQDTGQSVSKDGLWEMPFPPSLRIFSSSDPQQLASSFCPDLPTVVCSLCVSPLRSWLRESRGSGGSVHSCNPRA